MIWSDFQLLVINQVHIDEMRTLLEIHYDDVHTEKYMRSINNITGEDRKPLKHRKSEYKVFKGVVHSHKRQLCQRIQLPQCVKDLLPNPKAEGNWNTLQQLRKEIVLIAQGRRIATIDSPEEADTLASAICRGPDSRDNNDRAFFTSIGEGVHWIPPGSRLLLSECDLNHIYDTVRREARRDHLVGKVRLFEPGTQFEVLTRPFGTDLAPPQDYFIKLMADDRKTLRQCGRKAKPKPLNDNDPQAILDHMLLALWDALHLDDCIRWTNTGVANLPVEYTLELARYFNLGQDLSNEPVYSGMCALCANLLYTGPSCDRANVSNSRSGPPVNREGNKLYTSEGAPDTAAQPSCFLRFSPNVFAKEASHMFEHDEESNLLSLRNPDAGLPWMSERSGEWLYCVDCYDRFVGDKDRLRSSHVPFRDLASQHSMLTSWRDRKRQFEEMELKRDESESVNHGLDIPDGDDVGVQDDEIFEKASKDDENDSDIEATELPTVNDLLLPAQEVAPEYDANALDLQQETTCRQRPTLQEYNDRWEEKFAKHSKGNDEAFSVTNLCPKPAPRLWNNAPHVPFDQLHSPAAQGRLALVRPISGMEEGTLINGVEKYAHNFGDVHFCKRAPWQIASTMAFVLNKNSGSFLGLKREDPYDTQHQIMYVHN